MTPEDGVRVRHMADAAREAVAFAQGQTLESVQGDRMRALAMTRLFEIIGEAATTMSAELKAAHTQIPWRVMAGMRNRLIHAYFDVDLAVVLNTAQMDLPLLIPTLDALLKDEDGTEDTAPVG
jgi:uncharacterized protein with HEPN domain